MDRSFCYRTTFFNEHKIMHMRTWIRCRKPPENDELRHLSTEFILAMFDKYTSCSEIYYARAPNREAWETMAAETQTELNPAHP